MIIRISGGLGNQMFQYAFAKSFANKNNTPVKIDKTKYNKKIEWRPYKLDSFSISSEIISAKELESNGLEMFTSDSIINKIRRVLLKKLESKVPISLRRVIMEPQFTYSPEVFSGNPDALFIGEWQSEKYFSDIKDIVKKEFGIKNWSKPGLNFKKMIENENRGVTVSLHVRRGDNVTNPGSIKKFGTKNMDYYIKALETLKKYEKDLVCYVFSDDVDWVKENMSNLQPMMIVSDNGVADAEEIVLMSLCKHNIIAKSTFSWWGAWLNQNKNKIVIAPNDWFLIGTDTSDLIPKSWIQL